MSAVAQFVVFGEALTDFLREGPDRWRAAPGGAPWNVAPVAARLGVRLPEHVHCIAQVFDEQVTVDARRGPHERGALVGRVERSTRSA